MLWEGYLEDKNNLESTWDLTLMKCLRWASMSLDEVIHKRNRFLVLCILLNVYVIQFMAIKMVV